MTTSSTTIGLNGTATIFEGLCPPPPVFSSQGGGQNGTEGHYHQPALLNSPALLVITLLTPWLVVLYLFHKVTKPPNNNGDGDGDNDNTHAGREPGSTMSPPAINSQGRGSRQEEQQGQGQDQEQHPQTQTQSQQQQGQQQREEERQAQQQDIASVEPPVSTIFVGGTGLHINDLEEYIRRVEGLLQENMRMSTETRALLIENNEIGSQINHAFRRAAGREIARWEFFDETTGWIRYHPTQETEIERSYQDGQQVAVISVTAPNTTRTYTVDTRLMRQERTNQRDHKIRAVRRRVLTLAETRRLREAAAAAAAAPTGAAAGGNIPTAVQVETGASTQTSMGGPGYIQ